jgi:hypothetical protein
MGWEGKGMGMGMGLKPTFVRGKKKRIEKLKIMKEEEKGGQEGGQDKEDRTRRTGQDSSLDSTLDLPDFGQQGCQWIGNVSHLSIFSLLLSLPWSVSTRSISFYALSRCVSLYHFIYYYRHSPQGSWSFCCSFRSNSWMSRREFE